MPFQHRNLTKEQFLAVNRTALTDLIGEVNSELGSIYGARATKVNPHDVWVLFYIEAGLTGGKVDPNFRHSEGERGLLPLPSNVRFWNGPSAPPWDRPMPLETNLFHFFLYLGQLKNKVVTSSGGHELYPGLFRWTGIHGNPEHEAKLLAGVVHGYFYSPNYRDRRVPFTHILNGFAANDPLTRIMGSTRYVHAGTSVLANRETNISTALSLL